MKTKSIPYNELRKAAKLLNSELRADEQVKMNQTKEDMIKQFSTAVITLHESGRKFDNNILKFYNKHIVGEETETPAASASSAKTEKATPKKKTKKVGREIMKIIVKNKELDNKKILAKMKRVFPDRTDSGMLTTINHVVGVMRNYYAVTDNE
jgi:hypothetical protein